MAGRRFDKPGIGGATDIILHPERLALPLKWRKPRKIFVNSLSDVFHESVPDELIARGFATMAATPHHVYQLLTKRHARMRSLLSSPAFVEAVQVAFDALTDEHDIDLIPGPWPLANVHLGVSTENQKWADIRIPALLDTPAAVRWISAEPLLGPIDLGDLICCGNCMGSGEVGDDDLVCVDCGGTGVLLDWCVVGGESGPGARPIDEAWIRSLVKQCRYSTPIFVKQMGSVWAADRSYGGKTVSALGDRKGGKPEYWPEDLRVREYPQPVEVSHAS
jgi:protein gp37